MIKTYLDIDGVLADFFRAACALHGHNHERYPRGEWSMEKVFGLSWAEFVEGMDADWWANLPKCPDADYIVHNTLNPVFLTTHMDGRSVDGKHIWVEEHYPGIDLVFTRHKGAVACQSSILLDDRQNNIDEFMAGGGLAAVLLPSEWQGVATTPREVFDKHYLGLVECHS